MRVSPIDLMRVSKCPRRASNFRKSKTAPTKENIITFKVIQKAYLYLTETRLYAEWSTLLKHIDKLWYKDVDVMDDIIFMREKKRLEPLLFSLHRWHQTIYKTTNTPGYSNIYLEKWIDSHLLSEELGLVIFDDCPTVINVSFEERRPADLRLDYQVRITLWLLARCAEVEQVRWRTFNIKSSGGFSVAEYSMGKLQLKRMDNIIRQFLHILNDKMDYPTFIDCNECETSYKCVI